MRRLAAAPHANQIIWAITTQEEIGLRGAHTAVEIARPEIGIAMLQKLDATTVKQLRDFTP
jgi:putative aminopeptidase FrvX